MPEVFLNAAVKRPACNPLCRPVSSAAAVSTVPSPRPAAAKEPRRGVGVQRAKPFGAVCGGRRSGEERESRGRSPLALSAEDAAPARSGSPEGGALWRCPRRTPLRRGAGVQRAEPFGAVCGGRRSGEERESRGRSPLALSAEDAAPARSGSPEGRALWRCLRRTKQISAVPFLPVNIEYAIIIQNE